MTRIVVDASVSVAWCLDDEANDDTDALLARVGLNAAIVPVI